jgi:DNA polymerase III delta prime subunit
MFENTIGLEQITESLGRSVTAGELPPAVLLSGPRYGGKLTVALETARVLMCAENARWDCGCHACSLHRTLSHPDLMLAGPRYFAAEIQAALQAYRTAPRRGTRFLLIRAVRKLSRRFDEVLWDGARLRKVHSPLDEVETLLQEIESAQATPVGKDDRARPGEAALLKKLDAAVTRLLAASPRELVPIDLVRALTAWAHLSSSGGTKIVVMEELHTLQEGARNSLLKLVEEPPAGVVLLFTTSRRSAIIPTLLSRLRSYQVPERPVGRQVQVQEKVFRLPPEEPRTLADFFRQVSGHGDAPFRDLAEQLVDHILRNAPAGPVLEAIVQELGGKDGAPDEYFFEEFTNAARRRLHGADRPSMDRIRSWGPLIRTYRERIEIRNMNPRSVITNLVLALTAEPGA